MPTKIKFHPNNTLEKGLTLFLFICLFSVVNCSLPRTVAIKNKANPDVYVKVENGKLSAGTISDNKNNGLWQMKKLDKNHFTLKKLGSSNEYLHAKNNVLGYSVIAPTDSAAHWKVTKLEDNKHYNIENRLNPELTLHMESGALNLSNAVMAKENAQWAIVDHSTINPKPSPDEAMLKVAYLGVGYDAVYVDPEKLTKNSVQNGSLNPPQVFKFVPGTKTYDVKDAPDGKVIEKTKIVPFGVIVKPGENAFSWSNKARWVLSASKYQEDFKESFSGNIGLPGVASLKLSASFEDVESTTKSRENAYVYKEGSFSGHNLTIDLNKMANLLTDNFKNAVTALGTDDTTEYDTFIKNWGTHFSTDNTMGGKCSYRYTLNKSDFSKSSKTKEEFKEGVEVTLDDIKGGINSEQMHSKATSVSNKIKATEFTFISHGGNADFKDFLGWSEAAQVNETVIDLRLGSYLNLFNATFFPNDKQIKTKYALFNEALKRYYKKNNYTEVDDPLGFFKKGPRTYSISLTRLYVKKGNGEEQRFYSGKLNFGVYTTNGEVLKQTLFLNEDGDMWYDAGKVKWVCNCLLLKETNELTSKDSFNVTIQPDDLPGAFATITGHMTQTYRTFLDVGKNSMGDKEAFEVDETEVISLADLKIGQQATANKVTYTNSAADQNDIIEIYFEVKRIK